MREKQLQTDRTNVRHAQIEILKSEINKLNWLIANHGTHHLLVSTEGEGKVSRLVT